MAHAAPASQSSASPPPGDRDEVIQVEDLHVHFQTQIGRVRALNGVGFGIARGKALGVVGESGCGKSMTGLSILQLVPHPGQIVGGKIWFREKRGDEPKNLLSYDRHSDAMHHIRGKNISMIFQEPMTSLNPCYTVGNQIMEAILLHQTPRQDEARRHTIDILRRVGMPNPERIYGNYPHQLSGGMRQRAMIAMALSCTPALLIADEPTTALDVTTEAQILDLMRELQAEIGMSIMFVTHNLGVVAQTCDDVVVMYLGRVVERATVEEIFYEPKHPYTISLLRSIPHLGSGRKEHLEAIQGTVPDPYSMVAGCPFHPRCPSALPGLCDRLVPVETVVDGKPEHTVRCHLYPGSTVESVADGHANGQATGTMTTQT
ncbi:MAG TPA: ABC transporter ATP-binding protein [Chloroflexota bacterium]|nr:ABC transporter ATP-binding protein [Chloroflexota bacterium]